MSNNDRIWAGIKRQCLQSPAEGQSTTQQIDSAWSEVLDDHSTGPCRSVDINDQGHLVGKDGKISQDFTSCNNYSGFPGNLVKATGLVEDNRTADSVCCTSTLYFLDIAGQALSDISKAGRMGRVLCGGFDGRPLRGIAEDRLVPDGIDASYYKQHLHWTNTGAPGAIDGHINSGNHDGSDFCTIVPPEKDGLRTPKQLTINQIINMIHFYDREGLTVIRCALDGSALETLACTGDPSYSTHLADKSSQCVGVTVDHIHGHLYRSQKGISKGGQGSICRAGLDMPKYKQPDARSDVEVLFEGLPEFVDLDLDTETMMLYWANRDEAPLGNSLNRGYVGPDRATYLLSALPLERQYGYTLLANLLHDPINFKLDMYNDHLYAIDMGGAYSRFGLEGEGREKLFEYLGVYTGLALAYL